MLDQRTHRRQRLRNAVQGLLLVVGMLAVLAVVAWIVFGPGSLAGVLVVGGVTLVLRPKVPTQWVLRMYKATPIPPSAAPELHHFVAVLADRAGLPSPPRLHYVPSRLTNAFAVGRRDDAALAVTDGLLRDLSSREVAAVLAHEVSHIRSDDLWVMSLSDALGRLTHGVAYTGVFLVFLSMPSVFGGRALWPLLCALLLIALPTATTVLQLALSRSREYDADLDAAILTGDPEGMALALERLERSDGRLWERTMVPSGRLPDPLLLRTHPPTKERVRRLRQLIRPVHERHLGGDRRVQSAGYEPVSRAARLRAPGIRW